MSFFIVAAKKRIMGGSGDICKVQRVKAASKLPPKKEAKPIALEEMKVLSVRDIKDFLSKDIVDAGSDAEDCENSSSESLQQQTAATKSKVAGRPKKLGSRKPAEGKAASIFVGPPPPMAGKKVGLRMTEDGWVEVDFAEFAVNNPGLHKLIQPDDKS